MRQQAIGLAGPTAAGKSAAAMAIARALPVEIVSVDSALVYRGMDIGTAKPSADERGLVPHHLIDIRDPAEPWSAAEFVADARRLAGEIAARGRVALLVGGTMLYFKALTEGLDAMPAADPALRAAIDAEAARDGWAALHDELRRVDPATAARVPPGDTQRIQRALEVWRASGRPISDWQRGAGAEAREPWPLPLLSLEPRDRGWLHARIAERFRGMLDAGFVDEVRVLRARGDLHARLPSMRAVGYRQAWEALDSGRLDDLPERAIAATRQLAKRQLTWLRSTPARRVIACDDADATAQAVAAALELVRQG
jgi:tRNA dimethylallyltransferase